MSISQRASDVRSHLRIGKVGMFVDTGREQLVASAVNKAPQAKQIGTIKVDTEKSDHLYTVSIAGIPVRAQSGDAATKATVAEAIAEAINYDPIVRGLVSATSDGVDTVTVAALWPGVPFEMVTADDNLTVIEASVAAAEASPVHFGRLVVYTGTGTAPERETYATTASVGVLSAQVDTHTIAHVESAIHPWSITVDGVTYTGNVAAGANSGATATAIAGAINGAVPPNAVAAVADGDDVVLTAELPGRGFESVIGGAVKHSTSSARTDVNRAAFGFALFAYDEEDEFYPGNFGLRVARRGAVWVDSDESPDHGAPVYVDLSADNAGKVFTTSGANRVRLRDCSWGRMGGDGLVEVVFDFTRAA